MKLNTSQERAVAHLSGPMMVLAGPGSGKTSVIVGRTEYLIKQGRVEPSSILVVTFSRAAAKEMRERFLKQIHGETTGVTFGTFHSVFYSILRQAYRLGTDSILSEKEKNDILMDQIAKFGESADNQGDFLEEISKEIGMVKGDMIPIENYYSASCPDDVFKQIYRGYQEELRKRRKLDFDDMILYCYELFDKRKDILALWQRKYQYILIDEFQDINRLQYDIMKMLASPADNLFIVGDDDQSIYHFRGARPEIMMNFKKDYRDAEIVRLDINYRCSGNILKSAAELIGYNKKRFSKNLSTPNPDGAKVRALEFQTQREQYLSVVQMIRANYEHGERLEDMAILFRTNQEAEGVVLALMEYQIPFSMKETLPNMFYHWICRDMLAYLHMAAGDRSRKYFLQIMNRPNRYISREQITESIVDLGSLKAVYKDKDWMEDRITTLETHLKILGTLPPYAAVNFIRKAVGYDEYIRVYAEYRQLNGDDLMETMDRIHESTKGLQTLKEWEEHIEKYTEELNKQARFQEETSGVNLSTLHRVKGLEFERVYIVNVSEGIIPYRKAVISDSVEEERRLFYVGMTRAKKQLVICRAQKHYDKEMESSRFISEAGL